MSLSYLLLIWLFSNLFSAYISCVDPWFTLFIWLSWSSQSVDLGMDEVWGFLEAFVIVILWVNWDNWKREGNAGVSRRDGLFEFCAFGERNPGWCFSRQRWRPQVSQLLSLFFVWLISDLGLLSWSATLVHLDALFSCDIHCKDHETWFSISIFSSFI